MADRYRRMDDFIKYFRDILVQNPEKEFDDASLYNAVYAELVRIGVDRSNRSIDYSSKDNNIFGRLQSYFSGRRNTDCFIDPSWSYFLQFQNRKDEFYNHKDAIKIYIPQSSQYIERSARLLFDFLDKSDIAHISKIGKHERFDNIVVRVYNQQDADKILNYVSGEKQIQKGLIEVNPFAFSHNGIALACDRDDSYNCTIAHLMCVYYREKIANNALDTVGLNDFVYFAEQYYTHHFVNYEDLGEVVTDFNLEGCEANNIVNNKKICNIGNILHLYLCGLDQRFGLKDYYNQFLIRDNESNMISNAMAAGKKRSQSHDSMGSDYVGTIDSILLESVELFKSKYGYPTEMALDVVKKYLDEGNIRLITRDQGMRDRYYKSDFFNKMHKLLSISGKTIDEYYKEKRDAMSVRALNDAIFETYYKYENRYEQGFESHDGYAQAAMALFNYIQSKRVDWFTRDNNARECLAKYSDSDTAVREVYKNASGRVRPETSELYDYCAQYVTNIVNNRRKEHSNNFKL